MIDSNTVTPNVFMYSRKLVLWFLILLLMSMSIAQAQDLSSSTVRQVQRAYELQLEEQLQQAIDILTARQPSRRYDQAYVSRMLGGLYWQTQQVKQAIVSLTTAIDLKQLDPEQQRDTVRMLADILLSNEQPLSAERRYQSLITQYHQAKDLQLIWLRLAQAQYQQKKWPQVESSITKHQKYLKMTQSTIAISSLNLLLAAQIEQSKWQAAIPTARTLRDRQPKNSMWWYQLISLNLHIKNNAKALVIIQQAERAGIKLNEQYFIILAQLYAEAGAPYKAAQVYARLDNLDGRVSQLEQQALYWQAAKEWSRAEDSWYKAAQLDAKYYWQHALVLIKEREYQQAIASLNNIAKPTTQVQLAKIQAFVGLDNNQQALSIAKNLHKTNPSSESLNWIKYLSAN
ncbi:tetratricopeptide repeat protein [Vibrio sp. MA40-2]|uniref:tetratricopeptide repeat protein n=1 Tax=Vibrio sp. MA40-2 TaxID=3391828 RepID=UPI0039A76432